MDNVQTRSIGRDIFVGVASTVLAGVIVAAAGYFFGGFGRSKDDGGGPSEGTVTKADPAPDGGGGGKVRVGGNPDTPPADGAEPKAGDGGAGKNDDKAKVVPSRPAPEIDWGPLTGYFEITNVRVETRCFNLEGTGGVDEDRLLFDVKAKRGFGWQEVALNVDGVGSQGVRCRALDAAGQSVTMSWTQTAATGPRKGQKSALFNQRYLGPFRTSWAKGDQATVEIGLGPKGKDVKKVEFYR